MRIVFSRKGFDSTYGGAPSPIVDSRPISLPIPGAHGETTRYRHLGLGDPVGKATRGRLGGNHPCHDDPLFAQGRCWFGQTGAAQGHLRRQGVQEGDVFLFFGLFADESTGERHHRLFGCLRVACFGAPDSVTRHREWLDPPRPHPHLSGDWGAANCVWHGVGATAQRALSELRLTRPGGPLCRWIVPEWLRHRGLSYHADPARWQTEGELDVVRRGQEFVSDIGDDADARRWIDAIIAAIEAP